MRQSSPIGPFLRVWQAAPPAHCLRGRFRPVLRPDGRTHVAEQLRGVESERQRGRFRPCAAVAAANADPGSLIIFEPGSTAPSPSSASGELLIAQSVTIAGPGAGKLAVSGDNLSRGFRDRARTRMSRSAG